MPFSLIGAIIKRSAPILILKILFILLKNKETFSMKPAYWIGILALVGGVIGYALFRSSGPLGSGLGAILGVLIGAIIYDLQTRKAK